MNRLKQISTYTIEFSGPGVKGAVKLKAADVCDAQNEVVRRMSKPSFMDWIDSGIRKQLVFKPAKIIKEGK